MPICSFHAGTTVYRALKSAGITTGGWVAIVGAGGGLGHLYSIKLRLLTARAATDN